jgi:glycine cleavage system regulatory protein
MFSATARIVIPPDADVDALRERLEMLAQDIMVEIDIRAGST